MADCQCGVDTTLVYGNGDKINYCRDREHWDAGNDGSCNKSLSLVIILRQPDQPKQKKTWPHTAVVVVNPIRSYCFTFGRYPTETYLRSVLTENLLTEEAGKMGGLRGESVGWIRAPLKRRLEVRGYVFL